MSRKYERYKETNYLPVNIYLLFYLYIFAIFILANILPVSDINYFVFLFLGVTGIGIFVIKFTYSISIKKSTGIFSITIPFKVALLKLKIEEIKTLEQIIIDPLTYRSYGIKKSKHHNTYVFNSGNGLQVTMQSGTIFIISCSDPRSLIKWMNVIKEKRKTDID